MLSFSRLFTNKSFPLFWQHDAMQCGVACLQMVCHYFGCEYSIDELSDICFATRQGVSLLGISEAASQLGLHTVCGRATIAMLRKAPLPCILHWNQAHFVVLYGIRHDGAFLVADPAKGLVSYTEDEFADHWISTMDGGNEKGVAMFVEPTPKLKKRKLCKEQTPTRSFRFLYGYIARYHKYFAQLLLGLLVGSLLQLVLPFLTQAIVDVGIKQRNIGFVWLVLLGQLMLTISRTVVVVAHRLSTVCNAVKIVVMDGGRIVEIGTHGELVARHGAYYNLVKNQLELGN